MRPNRWRPWGGGIQARFLPVLAAFVIVSMAALGTTLFFNQRETTLSNFAHDTQEARRALHEKGTAYSNFLARIAPQGILSHDYLLLESYAEELSADPDIVYVVILNHAQKPITHFLKKTDPSVQSDGGIRVEPGKFAKSLTRVREDLSLMIVKRAIRYGDLNLGSVEVGLSQAKIARQLEGLKIKQTQELRRIAVLTGGLILIALILLILLSKWAFERIVVRPIQALGADMAHVQSGNLEVRARVDREDEIGWLARSFNQMTIDLQSYLRKLQEQRLAYKETRDYLANILDNSADMIVTTSLEGSVVEFNTAAERTLDYSREEIVGTSWDRVCASEEAREQLRAVTLNGKSAQSIEITLARGDGAVINTELTISALRDNAGQVIGTVYIGRDVTRARAMHRELIQAEKMASIGQVASWIAHQIRNVLGRLLMHVSTLRPPDEGKPALKKAHGEFTAGIHEMDMLVTDLLEYSKTLTLHRAPMKINASLDGLIASLIPDGSNGHVRIERIYDPALPVIQADVFKVEQAIGNVLKNAVDAMPEGGILHVSSRRHTRTGGVTVNIKDSGHGIRPDDLSRVFRPFFTTKPKGTGLGLAMAARIIEAHGGTIHAENVHQSGASFTLTLPEMPGGACAHE